ncbi:hypothetical protein M0R45_022933 [Rubus argutus]|uniref:Uncharacterized protein n=1 Tax=Rubus argutus TaxID=59490 RepID=A0AAW1WN45_RUBAR
MEVVIPGPATCNTSISTPSRRRCVMVTSDIQEIRVCTNRSCRRQGSMQTLETLTALAPPNVAVKSCGCLSRCGNGPNLVALPAGTLVGHCGTRARAAEVLVTVCGGAFDSDAANKSLEALALRSKAEMERNNNNFSQAELFLSQAIELTPIGGIHITYKDRSVARLALGNHSGALEDAAQALALNPLYPEAYICQGDAFLAMSQFDSAHNSYLTALQIDPSIRRSKSFKARIANLEKLTAVKKP